MDILRSTMGVNSKLRFLPLACFIILSLLDTTSCAATLPETNEIKTGLTKVSSVQAADTTTAFIYSTEATLKPLGSTVAAPAATKTTKANVADESAATKAYANTKSFAESARKQKLNTSSSALAGSARLQERLGAIDCDLPVLPSESRLWRGNETHELNLPVTDCGGAGVAEEDCPPFIVSWEGSTDIQSGDVLIVRIADSQLLDTSAKNATLDANSSRADGERMHQMPLQPAVYQVTRQGHEHCDVTEGMLVDVTPLDEGGSKLFTLYDKDLNEGVNLFIVVSTNWGSQCVRLKVTVKSDNCGESQDCSGKGVCYTDISMEGYDCQCCPGYAAPHCDEHDPCNPSPCLNNGICVSVTQPTSHNDYHCLCPYGFTGKKCEKDPCSSSPCVNGGSCMSMAMNGSTTFHCACAEGWTGAHCQLPNVAGACDLNPCVNGICVEHTDEDVEQKTRCFCQPGYTGDRCELEYNECASWPCANGGTCTDRVGGFQCSCGRGYDGVTCQLKVDLCSPNPCPEGRYCVDRGNNYACECPRGFVGDECLIPIRSPCDNNPCAHGGTCWNEGDSFYCSCRPGYTGKLCEEDFVLESVVGEEGVLPGRGGVRESRLQLGLYHDRLHNVFIALGTLGAAIAIVGVVVTACHCRVNKTYSRILSRLSRVTESGPPHHWLQDKRSSPPAVPFQPPNTALDTTDMYYTLDFSDSQSSPLIQ